MREKLTNHKCIVWDDERLSLIILSQYLKNIICKSLLSLMKKNSCKIILTWITLHTGSKYKTGRHKEIQLWPWSYTKWSSIINGKIKSAQIKTGRHKEIQIFKEAEHAMRRKMMRMVMMLQIKWRKQIQIIQDHFTR